MSKVIVPCSSVALAGLLLAGVPFGGVAQDRAALELTFITTDRGHAATVMEAGARQAAADLNVTLAYESLRSVDPAGLAHRIHTAVTAGPDGLVIAVDDIGRLQLPVETAAAMGLPIVSVGSWRDAAPPPGVLLHVYPDDTLAGIAAGRQLHMLGVTNALCLKVDVGDPAEGRCSGTGIGLGESGGVMDVLTAIDPAGDPSGIRGAVAARLLADPSIDGIVMTDAASIAQTLAAIDGLDLRSSLTLATFDLGPDASAALEAGEIAFVIDQQPFLQGYLAVMALALYARDGQVVGGGQPMSAGAVVVTQHEATTKRPGTTTDPMT